jgi:S-adenosylmethionine:tRNA ribosyltransferase-isomerase
LQQPLAMKTEELDYHLPGSLIAQFPSRRRDEARLLVLTRDSGETWHGRFRDLVGWLNPRDLLVVNDTKVFPARLVGEKATGGRVEVLLCEPLSEGGDPLPPLPEAGAFKTRTWRCLVRSSGRLSEGTQVQFGARARGILARRADSWVIRFEGIGDLRSFLRRHGQVPLPPYVARRPDRRDQRRYQTLFARREGSIAAPTAGLHFNKAVLRRLKELGVGWASITLQVGVGTFLPVRAGSLGEHRMHQEYVEVTDRCCQAWLETRQRGGRVVAVGTTVVRALESAVGQDGLLTPYRGFTELFVRPGHRFKAVDALLTNFHLPRTTTLALVMAFAGQAPVKKAYQEAIDRGYRFYSYGDAMFIC